MYSTNYFDLCVWANDGGMPGRLLYSKPDLHHHSATIIVLQNYCSTLPFTFQDIFVGWRKTTDRIMSVGIDKNTTVSQRNFYNTGQNWQASQFNYAIMIRPILSRSSIVGIDLPQAETEALTFILCRQVAQYQYRIRT